MPIQVFEFGPCFAFVNDAKTITPLPVGADFWQKTTAELPSGHLISRIRTEADWPNWEMHPSGEEFIFLLGGALDFILENEAPPVRVSAGQFIIVPRGVWHTANVILPSDGLFLTFGDGTQGRPREIV